MNAAQMFRWKRRLDQGLKEPGQLIPKSQMVGLQKGIEEWIEHDDQQVPLSRCRSAY